MENYLPPGFRFFPTEEELVSFYLHNKLEGGRDDLIRVMDQVIPVLDIYNFNPWDLPQMAGSMCRKDPEQWFFFIERQESEARGGRPKRRTTSGYWKATGSPNYVYSSSNNKSIGVKRTMVFYNGRAPLGTKTEWKMNEYKAIYATSSSSSTSPIPQLRQEFSLCRIYKKSKTLRSFDRRPQPQEPEMAQSAIDVQKLTECSSYDQSKQAPNDQLMVERGSSPESSSSKDVHDNAEKDADFESLWDWEQLNWF